nr:MAG TPA: hypothetical protein [Caudoviricetes sp.]
MILPYNHLYYFTLSIEPSEVASADPSLVPNTYWTFRTSTAIAYFAPVCTDVGLMLAPAIYVPPFHNSFYIVMCNVKEIYFWKLYESLLCVKMN